MPKWCWFVSWIVDDTPWFEGWYWRLKVIRSYHDKYCRDFEIWVMWAQELIPKKHMFLTINVCFCHKKSRADVLLYGTSSSRLPLSVPSHNSQHSGTHCYCLPPLRRCCLKAGTKNIAKDLPLPSSEQCKLNFGATSYWLCNLLHDVCGIASPHCSCCMNYSSCSCPNINPEKG